MEPKLERTTEFVMSSVQASPDAPVLFVKLAGSGTMAEFDGYLSLARLDDIERLKRQVREAAYDEIQQYITERLKALPQPTFGSFCPDCGMQNGHKNGCDHKPVKIGGSDDESRD